MKFSMVKITMLIVTLFLSGPLVGCSSDETEKKTTLQKSQEKIAAKAVESIKTPIDQANVARKLTEQHNKTVEEGVGSQ